MPAAQFRHLVQPNESMPRRDPVDACRLVFLPPVATTEDVRFVFESVLGMLKSDSERRSRWIVDISGLCRSSRTFADEVISFVEMASGRGYDLEMQGLEALPMAISLRIQELLALPNER